MESVEPRIWKQFSLDQFLAEFGGGHTIEAGFQQALYSAAIRTSTPRLIEFGTESFLLLQGLLRERMLIAAIGQKIGYFSKDAELLSGIDQRQPLPADSRWPRWFSQYQPGQPRSAGADIILRPAIPDELDYDYSFGQSGMFQAGLRMVKAFNNPAILYLQRSLQDKKSVLDESVLSISGEELYASFQNGRYPDPLRAADEPTHFLSGFIDLTTLISSIANIFPTLPDLMDQASASEVPQELDDLRDRAIMGRAFGKLLRWRLNPSDERANRRMKVVAGMFWRICDSEFRKNPQSGLDWSAPDSIQRYERLMSYWDQLGGDSNDDGLRGRGNNEPDGGNVAARRRGALEGA